jgi:hypothetical protein
MENKPLKPMVFFYYINLLAKHFHALEEIKLKDNLISEF